MLRQHPKFPTWHTQCHGNTLFFQLLPYFLCNWALSLGEGDHRGHLGRDQHAAEQAACSLVPHGGLPCHVPHTSHASDLPWPQHRGKNITGAWE